MEGFINTDIQALKIIFNRNKHYIIPIVVILICIGLIIKIIIPQFKTFLEVKEEARIASLRLEKLKKDLNMLESLSEEVLKSQLETTTLALPISKEFGGILNVLYSAAEASGVSIGKFSFQVGDLDKSGENEGKFSTINLSIALENNITPVSNFVNIIAKTVPLSGTSVVKTGEKGSTVGLSFYYKFLPVISSDSPIVPISREKISLLSKIGNFADNLQTNPASKSGVPFVKSTNPFAP